MTYTDAHVMFGHMRQRADTFTVAAVNLQWCRLVLLDQFHIAAGVIPANGVRMCARACAHQ
jgi:hypothetical protein